MAMRLMVVLKSINVKRLMLFLMICVCVDIYVDINDTFYVIHQRPALMTNTK